MNTLELLGAISSIATAIGVGVAAVQLTATRRQSVASFEDLLTAQYRAITEKLPLEALFGEPLAADCLSKLLPHFYRYFDLSNEQAFHFKNRRISDQTWANWRDGITSNMRRPAFATAWAEVARRASPDEFTDLRLLCPPLPTPGTRGSDA